MRGMSLLLLLLLFPPLFHHRPDILAVGYSDIDVVLHEAPRWQLWKAKARSLGSSRRPSRHIKRSRSCVCVPTSSPAKLWRGIEPYCSRRCAERTRKVPWARGNEELCVGPRRLDHADWGPVLGLPPGARNSIPRYIASGWAQVPRLRGAVCANEHHLDRLLGVDVVELGRARTLREGGG